MRTVKELYEKYKGFKARGIRECEGTVGTIVGYNKSIGMLIAEYKSNGGWDEFLESDIMPDYVAANSKIITFLYILEEYIIYES